MDGNLARAPRSYAEPLECSVAAIKSSPSAPLLCSFQGSGYSSTAQQHGKCVPLASSCLTGGFGVGCAVHQQQPPQHNTRMWWMGALQSQPRGFILSQRHHQELRVWGTLGAVLNAQEQKELNTEVLQN